MIESYVLYLIRHMPLRGWIFLTLWMCAVVIFACRIYRQRKGNVLWILMAFYVGIVLWVTLAGRNTLDLTKENPYEMVPFWSWNAAVREISEQTSPLITWQILLNIILFVPCGVLIYFLKKRQLRRTILWSMSFSFLIEVVQLIFCIGVFEWDDVLHNTMGYILGLEIGHIIRKIFFDDKTENGKKSGNI